MAIFCCEGRRDCVGLAAVVSVILGVIAALLNITAVITVAPAFLWVAFGIAIGYLAVLLIGVGRGLRVSACGCGGNALTAVLIGILGAALVSVILLAIPFAATSIVGAILVGLLVLFLSLIVTATACLVRCLANTAD